MDVTADISTTLLTKNEQNLPHVISALADGQIAIIPTDNVYGFIANGDRSDAVDRIYRLKHRERDKPLCYFTTREQASRYGYIDTRAERIMSLWPEAISVIVPRKSVVPDYVTSGKDSVLLVCIDQYSQQLAELATFPIVATSANISGSDSITSFDDACQTFLGKVDLILKSEASRKGQSSTIVNLTHTPPVIQRIGPVSVDFVKSIIPDIQIDPAAH